MNVCRRLMLKKNLFKRPGEAARTMLQYSGETDRVREREREIVRM